MIPVIALAGSLIQAAPAIARWLGGARAGEAAEKVVEVAKAVTGASLGEQAANVILQDPEKALAFQEAIANREAELDKAYLADTQSARLRDVELARLGFKHWRANALVSAAFILVAACLTAVVTSLTMSEAANSAVLLILGRALGWVEQVFSFEFGTTRTSQVKDDTIRDLSK